MTKRIRMPQGHVEVSLGGVNFKPDDTGAFNVPDEHADTLILHGGVEEPGLEQIQVRVDNANRALADAKERYERAAVAANDAAKELEAFKIRLKATADAAAAEKAAADAKAAEDARVAAAAVASAKTNGKK